MKALQIARRELIGRVSISPDQRTVFLILIAVFMKRNKIVSNRIGAAFERLVDIMKTLRGPDGCPWDRQQDLCSLRKYILEEAYEVVQAIDDDDLEALPSELGDLLLQVVFLSQLADEEGQFSITDVVESISGKLVRRHPHVFGEAQLDTADEVLVRWEAIKLEERGGGSVLDDIPEVFPALVRAEKLGRRASNVGFDWPNATGALGKVREELAEVEEATVGVERDAERPSVEIETEVGDLLFAISNFARHVGVSPEVALRRASEKFERRFRAIESRIESGDALDLEKMDALWDEVKFLEKDP
mgnify:FL=1